MSVTSQSISAARIVVDDRPLPYEQGDTVADAIIRAGQHPQHGGTLCLAGDCGNCSAVVAGVGFTRTCQTAAAPGLDVRRHPLVGGPPLRNPVLADPTRIAPPVEVAVRRAHVDVAVVGASAAGLAEQATAAAAGHSTLLLDGGAGDDVVGVFQGPTVIVRRADHMLHVHAHEVVIATGAAELHPVCEDNMLRGILTPDAAAHLSARGIELHDIVTVDLDDLDHFEGDDGWVTTVVTRDGTRHACRSVVVTSARRAPRDLLARMTDEPSVRVVGAAAERFDLPPAPTAGTVCPCSKVTVEDLDGVWQKGFQHLELVKRASLCGTGTCQGGVCMPHLRAFVADRSGTEPAPFTGRPASRQLTIAEAAAEVHLDAFRRTALHDEHLALGAHMDRFGGWWRPWNYGDHVREYWAVREAVSLGDVSTLGKMIVSGPDVVEALERLYPCNVADIRPGRSRYALLLNERGHVIDDGMILRESDHRFALSFTSGGASFAEMWVRDWIETWGLDVHVLDRTFSLAAINVTGPLAGELLRRAGLAEPPKMLQHVHADVAGVPCHVMRLSFTGEASFELHHLTAHSVELWRELMRLGADLGIHPHGLQALFGLRLEKGHFLVGLDSEMDSTPARLGLDWAVKMEKPFFIGRPALARTASLEDSRRLFGMRMDGSAPTEGAPIFDREGGEVIGHVATSFSSPLLGHAVLLGWQKRLPFLDSVFIDGRTATVAPTPFYDPEGARARL